MLSERKSKDGTDIKGEIKIQIRLKRKSVLRPKSNSKFEWKLEVNLELKLQSRVLTCQCCFPTSLAKLPMVFAIVRILQYQQLFIADTVHLGALSLDLSRRRLLS